MIDFYFYQNKILKTKLKNILIDDFKNIVIPDDVTTSIKIKNKTLIFIRDNSEYNFQLDICSTPKAILTLKEENVQFDVKVEYSDFIETKKMIKFRYKLETNYLENVIIVVKK